jgi:histidinol-phosphate aminotransferase
MQHPDRLIRAGLRSLEPYKAALPDMTPARLKEHLQLEQVAKLSFNENPFGTSSRAIAAMEAALHELHYYHDVDESGLKALLCAHHEVEPEQILLGNGADEIAQMAAMAFLNEGTEAIIPQPTYIQYEVSTLTMGADPVFVPVKDYAIDTQAILAKIGPKTKLIYICNPNNPTGTYIPKREMDAFVAALPDNVVVLLDEAYYDYVDAEDYPSVTDYLTSGKLIMGVRTFSKNHGLAAARVGYAIGPKALIYTIARTRMQVNVNHIGLCGAAASFLDTDHQRYVLTETAVQKAWLYGEFKRMGLFFVPSQGNFIFVDTGVDSAQVLQDLAAQGVVVRPGHLFGYPTFLRITVGTPAQNQTLIAGLAGILGRR